MSRPASVRVRLGEHWRDPATGATFRVGERDHRGAKLTSLASRCDMGHHLSDAEIVRRYELVMDYRGRIVTPWRTTR